MKGLNAYIFLATFFFSSSIFAEILIPIATDPNRNEYFGSAFLNNDNQLCVIFSQLKDPNELLSDPMQTCAVNLDFGTPSPVLAELSSATPVSTGWVIDGRKGPTFYFNAYDKISDRGYWGLARYSNGRFQKATWLQSPEDLSHQFRPWIYPARLADGRIILSYEIWDFEKDYRSLRFSLSTDGRTFQTPLEVVNKAQMFHFGEFADGSWAFAYQRGNAGTMRSYVVLTRDDGRTFTVEKQISDQKGNSNVHDSFLFRRIDGDLDIYYLLWKDGGFSCFRRRISSTGDLGPEERVTESGLNMQKPTPFRLPDGKIFLVLSQVKLWSSDVVGMILETDALSDSLRR
ncbi:MAG: sialidase family protein [Oligoflexales bacterium]